MKTGLLTLFTVLYFSLSFAQTNFIWDEKDSILKNKNEIYSITKMFISEYWKSANDVIQNDDKEGGMILLKGLTSHSLVYQMNDHKWTYSYNVKFLFKDNKYRIVIENIQCHSARCGIYEWPLMPISETYPAEKGLASTGVNEVRYLELMGLLKTDMQQIVDAYKTYLKNSKSNDEGW